MNRSHVISAATRVHLRDRISLAGPGTSLPDVSKIRLPESGVHAGAEYTRGQLEEVARRVDFPSNLLDEWEKTEQVFATKGSGEADTTLEQAEYRMSRLAEVVNSSIALG